MVSQFKFLNSDPDYFCNCVCCPPRKGFACCEVPWLARDMYESYQDIMTPHPHPAVVAFKSCDLGGWQHSASDLDSCAIMGIELSEDTVKDSTSCACLSAA